MQREQPAALGAAESHKPEPTKELVEEWVAEHVRTWVRSSGVAPSRPVEINTEFKEHFTCRYPSKGLALVGLKAGSSISVRFDGKCPVYQDANLLRPP